MSARRTAAALRYERGKDSAPKVLATGSGRTAERILELAREAGVPVREDAALAEALARLPVDLEIPEELFVAVAEVLVWAYGVDRDGGI